MPITDCLSQAFSLRRYLLVNTALFLLFSVASGHAHSLSEMIIYRALQGFTGGVLIPFAFTIILSMLPPSKHAMGLAVFAVTATFGPAIGGWMNDIYRWPWVFYVNLGPRRTDARGTLVRPAERGDATRPFAGGDWRGIALMGDRPRRIADRAR